MSALRWVQTEESCPACGDVWEVLTGAEQTGGLVRVQDGDAARCADCGAKGAVHDWDVDGISIEPLETP